jgi:hypothetical protein
MMMPTKTVAMRMPLEIKSLLSLRNRKNNPKFPIKAMLKIGEINLPYKKMLKYSLIFKPGFVLMKVRKEIIKVDVIPIRKPSNICFLPIPITTGALNVE